MVYRIIQKYHNYDRKFLIYETILLFWNWNKKYLNNFFVNLFFQLFMAKKYIFFWDIFENLRTVSFKYIRYLIVYVKRWRNENYENLRRNYEYNEIICRWY